VATEQFMRTSFVTLYGVGALVTGTIIARSALRQGVGWVVAHPPRTILAWIALPFGVVAAVAVGGAVLVYVLLVWPIVLTVIIQTRRRHEDMRRALDQEEEAELFREARRLGR
jgi:hypothetical protein